MKTTEEKKQNYEFLKTPPSDNAFIDLDFCAHELFETENYITDGNILADKRALRFHLPAKKAPKTLSKDMENEICIDFNEILKQEECEEVNSIARLTLLQNSKEYICIDTRYYDVFSDCDLMFIYNDRVYFFALDNANNAYFVAEVMPIVIPKSFIKFALEEPLARLKDSPLKLKTIWEISEFENEIEVKDFDITSEALHATTKLSNYLTKKCSELENKLKVYEDDKNVRNRKTL